LSFNWSLAKGLNDHPCPILSQGLPDVCGCPDRVAHVMQAIEDGHEVVVCAGKLLRLCHAEGDSVGGTITPGGLASRLNRLVMVVESEESGLRECFCHQQSGRPFPATDVGHSRPGLQLRLDIAQGGNPCAYKIGGIAWAKELLAIIYMTD
jgi:hypothetical protein